MCDILGAGSLCGLQLFLTTTVCTYLVGFFLEGALPKQWKKLNKTGPDGLGMMLLLMIGFFPGMILLRIITFVFPDPYWHTVIPLLMIVMLLMVGIVGVLIAVVMGRMNKHK